MYSNLVNAIENSDLAMARASLESILGEGQVKVWAIHDALFPVVHRVLNPPFINPHLAKMYAINRELVQYLDPADIALLLRVEIEEYTRRDKLSFVDRPVSLPLVSDFTHIEKAIAEKDVAGTASAMASFSRETGLTQLVSRLLLLGSGFLNSSLGHSVSCTAFILQEITKRKDEDLWPVFALLADYFCKGKFQQTSKLQYSALSDYREVYLTELKRAVSGAGVVALHHTITLYAIERSRHFFEPQEYDHLLTMWMHMLGEKQEELIPVEEFGTVILPDFQEFYSVFSTYNPVLILNMVKGVLNSREDRNRLGSYLIKSVLQCYNGRYDPHYLTGLGASLWVIENFHDQPDIVMNALLQYLNYFFSGIR
ncbi:MAG: hypothetical protein ACN4GW_19050 [Desulforhopalus sp.]